MCSVIGRREGMCSVIGRREGVILDGLHAHQVIGKRLGDRRPAVKAGTLLLTQI
jgi:hypothetical protein